MLPDWRKAPGCKREGKSPQRRELVPLFRRVPQNPFDGAGFVIKAYEKIFPAGNDNGVVRAIVCRGVVMKPVTAEMGRAGGQTELDRLPRRPWLR